MLSYAIRAAFLLRAATRSFLLPHNANLFAYLVSWVAFSFLFGHLHRRGGSRSRIYAVSAALSSERSRSRIVCERRVLWCSC
jgi:hypothetical protein